MPFPFPDADKRYRITMLVGDGLFTCEKNADGRNHALERAVRQLERDLIKRDDLNDIPQVEFQLIGVELIAEGTKPGEKPGEGEAAA